MINAHEASAFFFFVLAVTAANTLVITIVLLFFFLFFLCLQYTLCAHNTAFAFGHDILKNLYKTTIININNYLVFSFFIFFLFPFLFFVLSYYSR